MSDQAANATFEPSTGFEDPALTHGASDQTYVMVAIFLAVMTAMEVICSYTENRLGPFYDWVLITLMAIKFFTVALYFMHLRYDRALCRRVFFFGLGLASSVYVLALATFNYWAPGFR